MNPHLVVAVGGHRDLAAMRWAVEEALRTGERVRVVHATSTPVAVDGVVPETVADALGHPLWATIGRQIHDLAIEVGVPMPDRRVSAAVAHARPDELILRHSVAARLVVLGPAVHASWWRRRRSVEASLERRLSCAIVRPDALEPVSPSVARPRPPAPLNGLATAA